MRKYDNLTAYLFRNFTLHLLCNVRYHREVVIGKITHIDKLDLPDFLHQLHGCVAINEEGLGVVSEL